MIKFQTESKNNIHKNYIFIDNYTACTIFNSVHELLYKLNHGEVGMKEEKKIRESVQCCELNY